MIPQEAMIILATIGLTPDQASQVARAFTMIVEACEAKAEAADKVQRAVNAARQARWRDRHITPHSNVTDGDITLRSVTQLARVEDNNQPTKKLDIPPVDPNGSTAPKGADRRGSRLPEGWYPSEDHKTEGRKLGLTEPEFDRIVDEFRNYWLSLPGPKSRKLDWSRTFLNRLREQAPRVINFRPKVEALLRPSTEHGSRANGRFFVKRETPQWEAWAEHMKANRQTSPPSTSSGGWWFSSEWPPGHERIEAA